MQEILSIVSYILIFVGILLFIQTIRMAYWFFMSIQLSLNSRPFSIQRVKAKQKILVIGDSTAAGTGAEDPSLSVAGRLAKRFPNATIVNRGKNGATTKHVLAELRTVTEKFDLMLIQTGANDILRFTNVATLKQDIAELLEKAKTLSKSVVLLTAGNVGLSPSIPRILVWLYTSRTKQVRTIFMTVAKEKKVLYVDLFREKEDDLFLTNTKLYYAKDMLHPSSEGYRVWFEEIIKTLKKNNVVLKK